MGERRGVWSECCWGMKDGDYRWCGLFGAVKGLGRRFGSNLRVNCWWFGCDDGVTGFWKLLLLELQAVETEEKRKEQKSKRVKK